MKSVIFDNIVCEVMPTVTHRLQKKQQKLIHDNKKNRILIVNGDNPDNHSILKLDLERNGFIVDTFTDPLVALNNFQTNNSQAQTPIRVRHDLWTC